MDNIKMPISNGNQLDRQFREKLVELQNNTVNTTYVDYIYGRLKRG